MPIAVPLVLGVRKVLKGPCENTGLSVIPRSRRRRGISHCFENRCAEGTLECGIRQPTDSYRLGFGFQSGSFAAAPRGSVGIFMVSEYRSRHE